VSKSLEEDEHCSDGTIWASARFLYVSLSIAHDGGAAAMEIEHRKASSVAILGLGGATEKSWWFVMEDGGDARLLVVADDKVGGGEVTRDGGKVAEEGAAVRV
ncbi:hypothetical protein V8G54_009365, partial [Vigna mungo]